MKGSTCCEKWGTRDCLVCALNMSGTWEISNSAYAYNYLLSSNDEAIAKEERVSGV